MKKSSLVSLYQDPSQLGALGGVETFARAQGVSIDRARQAFEGVLSYTLHKPRRRRFPTTQTLVFGRDEQWQMDLLDTQPLARYNRGFKYLLTVIDVLSKTA